MNGQPWRSVTVIHASPIVAAMTRDALVTDGIPCGPAFSDWNVVSGDIEHVGTHVVLDAYLDDHVPLALKVRALHRLPAVVLVLGQTHQPSLTDRVIAEGAHAWLEPDVCVETLKRHIRGALQLSPSVPAQQRDATDLTDRELQLLCLSAGRLALSSTALGVHFGISAHTVRTHLRNGRAKYRTLGRDVSTRRSLAAALVQDGYLVSDETWRRELR